MKPKTILLADDDRHFLSVLKMRFKSLGLDVRSATDALQALNVAHRTQPDVICLDVNMPCGDGLGVCEMLANDGRLGSTPVIIMTGQGKSETMRRCFDLKAYYVEKCTDTWSRLAPLVCELVGMEYTPRTEDAAVSDPIDKGTTAGRTNGNGRAHRTPAQDTTDQPQSIGEKGGGKLHDAHADVPAGVDKRPDGSDHIDTIIDLASGTAEYMESLNAVSGAFSEPPYVLCIDDDADYSNALRRRLERYEIVVVRACEGMEGFRFAFANPPQAILLDYEMPDGRGDYVLDRLKRTPGTEDVPVIVITGHNDRVLERKMLGLGAARFLTKPVDSTALLAELSKHIDLIVDPCPTD